MFDHLMKVIFDQFCICPQKSMLERLLEIMKE